MNDSELLKALSRKTGLPESAAEAILRSLRELVHEGAVDARVALSSPGDPATVGEPAAHRIPITDPKDPRVVDEVIARARRHPLGLEFLASGLLASVAIALGAHAFTVDAARARLRKEKAAEPKETSAS